MYRIIRIVFIFIVFILAIVSFDQGKFYLKYFGIYVVESDSMRPAFKRGDLLFVGKSDAYKEGEIITYKYPLAPSKFITHRVVSIEHDNNIYYRTKGDANADIDPWQVRSDLVLGRLHLKMAYLGYPILFIKKPLGLFLIVLVPAVSICAWEIRELIKKDYDTIIHYWNLIKERF